MAKKNVTKMKNGEEVEVAELTDRGSYTITIAPPVTVPGVVTVKKVK